MRLVLVNRLLYILTAINELTDISSQIPQGEWKYVHDLITKISEDTFSNIVLSQYDPLLYNTNELKTEAIRLPEDAGYAWLLDGQFKQSCYDKIIMEDLVLFYFAIEGGHTLQFPQKGEIHQEGVRLALGVYQQAHKQVKQFQGALNYRYVVIGLRLTEFHHQFGYLLNEANPDLRDTFSLQAAEPSWQFYPLKNNLKNICNDILDSRGSMVDDLRYRFLQGKFTELLCLTLSYIFAIDHIPCQRINLTNSDLEKIRSAKSIIDSNKNIRPTLDSLAKDLIISRKKLAYGFKAFYGIGVNEYYNQERLEDSRRELQKGALGMLDIIELSGYQSQAAFSRAYKNYFGHSPKADKAI